MLIGAKGKGFWKKKFQKVWIFPGFFLLFISIILSEEKWIFSSFSERFVVRCYKITQERRRNRNVSPLPFFPCSFGQLSIRIHSIHTPPFILSHPSILYISLLVSSVSHSPKLSGISADACLHPSAAIHKRPSLIPVDESSSSVFLMALSTFVRCCLIYGLRLYE